MPDDEPGKARPPLCPPAAHPARTIVRAVAESAVDLVPFGGLINGVVRVAHPSKAETEEENWRDQVTERSNEHDATLREHYQALNPAFTIDGVAAQLAQVLSQHRPDGLGHEIYFLEDMEKLLPEAEPAAIEEAVYDLQGFGLLNVVETTAGPRVVLNQAFYQQADHQVMGWDTRADAKVIAELMLSEDTGHAPDLHEITGWSKRRFNPAFAMVVGLIPEGRVRQVHQPDYFVLGVVMAPADRAALKRSIRDASL